MAFDLKSLNEEQLKPVLQTAGPVLVTAGAGSGKTRLLTHRVAHIINDLGVDSYNILAITFTNKAANEMKERLSALGKSAYGLWISTFHSLCVSIMRRYVVELGNNYTSSFSIYDEDEKLKLLKNITNGEDDLAKRAESFISMAKNEGVDCEDAETKFTLIADIENLCKIYKAYSNALMANNAFDFDDLLLTAFKILNMVPKAREYYQERFKYIHVDEFQDTNNIQYQIVKLLAQKYKNILVVGDEDQSIYGWRGANIENIGSFIDDFNPTVFKLEQNYRSTKNILDIANLLIKNNTTRIDKSLWTENEEGAKPYYFVANTETDEAEFVVQTIMSLRKEGYSLNDFAILMRVNALSRSFEQKFILYNIKHKVYGGFKFFERKEIKDLLAYMRVAVNHSDNEALLRIINFPKRGIGESTVAQANNYAMLNNLRLYDVLITISDNKDLPLSVIKKLKPFEDVLHTLDDLKTKDDPYEFLSALVETLNLREVYGEDTDENVARKMNISELIHTAQEFNLSHQNIFDISDEKEYGKLENFLQMVSLYTDMDEMDNDDGCVNIITAHSAKGLEFKVVFIIGMEENLFPTRRSVENCDIEEERRLMYVAITRAQKRLFITRARSRFLYGARKDMLPSRFLYEIGMEKSREKQANNAFYRAGSQKENSEKITFYVNKSKVENKTPIEVFKIGTRIRHKKFGEGEIISIEEGGRYAVIRFAHAGDLTLSLQFAPIEIIKGK